MPSKKSTKVRMDLWELQQKLSKQTKNTSKDAQPKASSSQQGRPKGDGPNSEASRSETARSNLVTPERSYRDTVLLKKLDAAQSEKQTQTSAKSKKHLSRFDLKAFPFPDKIGLLIEEMVEERVREKFIDILENHLDCPICHETLVDPIILSCSHSFCSSCIGNRFQSTCPYCRGDITSRVKSLTLRDIIDKMVAQMSDEYQKSRAAYVKEITESSKRAETRLQTTSQFRRYAEDDLFR